MCSGVHRGLGVQTSFVKSVSMDNWPDKHRQSMELGGNGRLRAYFETSGIDKMPIRTKYNTKAAEYYRVQLRAQLEGKEPPPPISKEEGQKLVTTGAESSMTSGFNRTGSQPIDMSGSHSNLAQQDGNGGDGLFGSLSFGGAQPTLESAGETLSNWGSTAWGAIGSWGAMAQETAKQKLATLPPDSILGQISTNVASGAAWTVERGKEALTKVQSEEFWNNAQQTASNAGRQVGEVVGNVINYRV